MSERQFVRLMLMVLFALSVVAAFAHGIQKLKIAESRARLEALETHAKLCPEIVDRHNKECPFWSEEESP